MKLLLTSAGIKNTSIRTALVDMLGKPIDESSALVVPTGIYPFPGGAGMARSVTRSRTRGVARRCGGRSGALLTERGTFAGCSAPAIGR